MHVCTYTCIMYTQHTCARAHTHTPTVSEPTLIPISLHFVWYRSREAFAFNSLSDSFLSHSCAFTHPNKHKHSEYSTYAHTHTQTHTHTLRHTHTHTHTLHTRRHLLQLLGLCNLPLQSWNLVVHTFHQHLRTLSCGMRKHDALYC